ncbi:MAG TPA: DNA repair protein RecN [Acidimicrobiales bacterium]|nr:DNA repair protein RecN [Acidimicrobiales bacterium]
MLKELRVRDLGVIGDLTLELGPGMTALTGETGAGKTLLVHALQLVLGGRAVPGLVRAGASEALVEARFELVADDGLMDGTFDGSVRDGEGAVHDGERFLARSVPVSGRSRAWVDGRMAPLGMLAELGAGLVDIHGQHDQQSLLSVTGQRAALDACCGSDLAPLASARAALADVRGSLAALGGDERERARQADLLRYQVAEIDAAHLEDVDEDAALAAEEARLAAMTAIREAAAGAVASLRGADGSTGADGGASGLAAVALVSVAPHLQLEELAGRLRDAVAELDDVAAELRGVAETWEEDPERLEEVQARRRLLGDLRRKYGETLADVVAFGEAARASLADLAHQGAEAVRLEAERAEAEHAVRREEERLRELRAGAAPALAAAVTARLSELAMPGAALEVAVGEEGAGDAVQFLLAANPGEPAQPLGRVASGGELARTMLALRLVVEGGAPTMLFDEVDAGVGGSAALALARALRDVASHRQVLVVTHLPQVAAFADRQIGVAKHAAPGGRTVTTAEVLDAEGRIVELSRMLSGHPHSATARAHAEELLTVGAAAVSTTRGAPSD